MVFVSLLLTAVSCSRTNPFKHLETEANSRWIPFESDFSSQVEVCPWKENKKAAYTIEFDDNLKTHYQVAYPALIKRNIQATFCIDTKSVAHWYHWRRMALSGHEIASHSWSHPRMPGLDESQLRDDLSRAVSDILSGIPEQTDVASFSYPYGLHDENVRKIVSEYHESARGGAGLNPLSIPADDYWGLRGIGIYPPYDMSAVRERLLEGIRNRSWILVYFHSISTEDSVGPYTVPQSLFIRHVDDVVSLRDSLWIAPQRDVVRYTRLRDRAQLRSWTMERNRLRVTLLPDEDEKLNRTELSMSISLPSGWLNEILVIRSASSQGLRKKIATSRTQEVNLCPGDTLTISAVTSYW